MKAYSLLIGSPNRTGRLSQRDERILQSLTARHFPDGFTMLDARGAWYDPDHRVFRKEDARQITVGTSDARRLKRWCRELGAARRQKELVLLEIGRTMRIRIPASGRRTRH